MDCQCGYTCSGVWADGGRFRSQCIWAGFSRGAGSLYWLPADDRGLDVRRRLLWDPFGAMEDALVIHRNNARYDHVGSVHRVSFARCLDRCAAKTHLV